MNDASRGDNDLLSEVLELTHALVTGEATEEQQRRHHDLITTNPSARHIYINAICDQLILERVTKDRPEQDSEASDDALPKIEVESASFSRRTKRYDSIHWQRHKIRFNAMTAVLTALAWAGFSYFVWYSTTPDEIRPNRSGNIQYVAEITGQYEARWADDLHQNTVLLSGERLNLVEGLLELTFTDGAVVVLEGPTEFVVNSSGVGTLENGRLAATVPPAARGFTINTSAVRIVDLGTEFGVEVSQDKMVRVHTFEGMVVVSDLAGGRDVRVKADQYVEVEPTGRIGLLHSDSENSGQFVRILTRRPWIQPTHTFFLSSTKSEDHFIENHAEVWYIHEDATLTLTGDKVVGRIFIATSRPPQGDAFLTIVGGGTLHVAGGVGGIGLRLGHLEGNGVGTLTIHDGSIVRIDHDFYGQGDGGIVNLVDGTLIISNEKLGRPWVFLDFEQTMVDLRADGASHRPEAFSFEQGTGDLIGFTEIRRKSSSSPPTDSELHNSKNQQL